MTSARGQAPVPKQVCGGLLYIEYGHDGVYGSCLICDFREALPQGDSLREEIEDAQAEHDRQMRPQPRHGVWK